MALPTVIEPDVLEASYLAEQIVIGVKMQRCDGVCRADPSIHELWLWAKRGRREVFKQGRQLIKKWVLCNVPRVWLCCCTAFCGPLLLPAALCRLPLLSSIIAIRNRTALTACAQQCLL